MKQYENVPIQKPKSSVFDLSHEHKLSMNMGELVPILCQEVIPGDNFRLSYEAIVKLQPILAPIMHRVNVHAHFFFVPNRLIWKDFEDFITGGPDGDLAPNFPKITGDVPGLSPIFTINSLADYLGYPVTRLVGQEGETPPISQLPFRAYQLIYNEYYRDQTLQDKVSIPLDSVDLDESQVFELCKLRKRCWEKDYFTSCLPNAQRGDAVRLPLGDSAPISGIPKFKNVANNLVANGPATFEDGYLEGNNIGVKVDGGTLQADLSEATAATVTDVRTAFAVQRWLEKMARGGARYIEQILNFFGVKSSDARLQRPEFIGGGKLPIQIAEVVQTSQTDTTAQGNMTGHGVAAGNMAGFSKFFEEHGLVIGILSITPRTAYLQGIPKLFTKFDRFEYFWPQFAHIGEQPVKYKEIYAMFDVEGLEDGEKTFGYQPRYMEYRMNNDRVSGDFRDTLDFWHLARIFDNKPTLNSDFVTCVPDDRIFPVISGDSTGKFKKVLVMGYFKFTAIRPIPKYGEPI